MGWSGNSKQEFTKLKERFSNFVGTGQLFTNGYWGHPAMKLTPEVNLLVSTDYLQALEVQRYARKIVSVLGSKSSHIQNMAVGGVSNPIALDSQSVLSIQSLLAVKEWIDKLNDFIKNAYLVDVAAIGAFYANWTAIGGGVMDYLSCRLLRWTPKAPSLRCRAAISRAAIWPESSRSRPSATPISATAWKRA